MLSSNAIRAKVLHFAILMQIITTFAALNCYIIQFWVLKQLDAGVQFVNKDLLRLEEITDIVLGIAALTGMFLFVIFVVWLYRAYCNLQRLDRHLEVPKLMLIFGWIIPIYNIIMPFRWIDKLNYTTYFMLKRKQVQNIKLVDSNWLLLGWCALIIANFIRAYMNKQSAFYEYDTLMQLGIAKEICAFVGVLILSYFINNYRKLENILFKVSLEESKQKDQQIDVVNE